MKEGPKKSGLRRLAVLVIDDSARARQALLETLQSLEAVEVVGVCENGEEGLRRTIDLEPDLITLDLEMPKMDGFTFLRVLQARHPTPVLVVSSFSGKDNIFRALELGAVDFISKPNPHELGYLRAELKAKMEMVRSLRPLGLRPLGPTEPPASPPYGDEAVLRRQDSSGALVARDGTPRSVERSKHLGTGEVAPAHGRARRIIAIGASTGGPPALQHILGALSPNLSASVVVAQHMPARFTEAFAARLNRQCGLKIKEAAEGDLVEEGQVLLAPGGQQMLLREVDSDEIRVSLQKVEKTDTYVPSVDKLFESVAGIFGSSALGVVLTGMGRDGREGVLALDRCGAQIIAESEDSAIVHGMPKEAAATGCVDQVLPLEAIAAALMGFAKYGRLP